MLNDIYISFLGNVVVDFYVMAKCPDAVFCELNFLPGISAVASIIDLNINYIANETEPGSGQFECRHGPGECTGDIQQLCVRAITERQNNYYRINNRIQQEPLWSAYYTKKYFNYLKKIKKNKKEQK